MDSEPTRDPRHFAPDSCRVHATGPWPLPPFAVRRLIPLIREALTNYLLGILVMKDGNPIPPAAKEQFKQVSEKTINNVMEIVSEKGCGLTKAELAALQGLADSYKEIFKLAD